MANENNKQLMSKCLVLDLHSDKVMYNKILIVLCSSALIGRDPLLFNLPVVVRRETCVYNDAKLRKIAPILRTIVDFFCLLHVIVKFRTACVVPSTTPFGRGEVVTEPKAIARRYLRNDFIIDLMATLHLPQIGIWFIMPTNSASQYAYHNGLAVTILVLYIRRLFVIFQLRSQIIKAIGALAKSVRAVSHFVGGAWYTLFVDRQTSCWRGVCREERDVTGCVSRYIKCDTLDVPTRKTWANIRSVFTRCNPNGESSTFKYGIFESAFTNDIIFSDDVPFLEKCFHCFLWGFKNLG